MKKSSATAIVAVLLLAGCHHAPPKHGARITSTHGDKHSPGPGAHLPILPMQLNMARQKIDPRAQRYAENEDMTWKVRHALGMKDTRRGPDLVHSIGTVPGAFQNQYAWGHNDGGSRIIRQHAHMTMPKLDQMPSAANKDGKIVSVISD